MNAEVIIVLLLSNQLFLGYVDEARLYAEDNDLDPEMYISLIYVESSWGLSLESHKNAYGLSQMIPETASRVAGYEVTSTDLINDHSLSLELGACYLGRLVEISEGDIRLALTRYFYGENTSQSSSNWYVDRVFDVYYNIFATWSHETGIASYAE